MRKPILAGNWKLHKNSAEALELITALEESAAKYSDREIIVAPVFTTLAAVTPITAKGNIQLAAQNCYFEESGAFTGEVSPSHLLDIGCSHVILGHSERREIFGESDELINQKTKSAIAAGLQVIFCIGEKLEAREANETFEVLKTQVTQGLAGLSIEDMSNVTIAYEPVWAIGTGKTASPEQAQEAHAFIRGLVAGLFSLEVSEKVRILYGGSVKPNNVDDLMAQGDIDGALVGGASLKPEDFNRIISFNH